jgi:uncharacterized coiled-coil protein SlyX
LWYFGFISFHWRDQPPSGDRLRDVETQIARADSQLHDLSEVVREISEQSDTLDNRRRALQEQVARLERARDQIALSLDRASSAVSLPARSHWRSVFDLLFSGVPSNLISSALVGLIAWYYGRRAGRRMASANEDSS